GLCCITVALVAIMQIDSPLQVFTTGVERGAAIAVGVLAYALVNDTLAAPDYHPVLAMRLEALHRQVIGYADSVARGEAISATAAAGILRDIAAMHPEVASLATESSSGTARSVAAQSVMVDLASEFSLVRALAVLRGATPLRMGDRAGVSSALMA